MPPTKAVAIGGAQIDRRGIPRDITGAGDALVSGILYTPEILHARL